MVLGMAIALLSPLTASAQSQLDAAQAQPFMGEWVVNMDTDFGPFALNLSVTDQSGKVAASIGSPDLGGSQAVTDITGNPAGLVLKWELDAQGQIMDVSLSLIPAGANLATIFQTADGQFSAAGTATKASG
jgi:hypothetical protein